MPGSNFWPSWSQKYSVVERWGVCSAEASSCSNVSSRLSCMVPPLPFLTSWSIYYLHYLLIQLLILNQELLSTLPTTLYLFLSFIKDLTSFPYIHFSSTKMQIFVDTTHTHICVFITVLSKYIECPPNIIDFILDCLNCLQPQTACLQGL